VSRVVSKVAHVKTPDHLAYALGPNVHRSWTGRLHITQADDSLVTLSAPTRFIASKIETQYADTVRRLWNKYDQVDPPPRATI